MTAKKSIRSKKSSRCSSSISTKLTSKSSILSYRGLSPKQRAMVAESKLRMIEIENESRLLPAKNEKRASYDLLKLKMRPGFELLKLKPI